MVPTLEHRFAEFWRMFLTGRAEGIADQAMRLYERAIATRKSATAAHNIVATDFDGTICFTGHEVEDPTKVEGKPTEGAFAQILDCMDAGLRVIVHTARMNNPHTDEIEAALRQWMLDWDFPADKLKELEFTATKPSAQLYIDNRAWPFIGPKSWPTVEDIKQFVPWDLKALIKYSPDQPRDEHGRWTAGGSNDEHVVLYHAMERAENKLLQITKIAERQG